MPRADASSAEPNELHTALAIGNFDGVHRGHQALVRFTLELAARHGLRPQAMTFEPHPAQVLSGTRPPLLTSLERKTELLRRLSPELQVVVQTFDREFSLLSPLEFVERVLVGTNHVRQLVVGANFRFGRDRAGNVDALRQLADRFGFEAHSFALSEEAGSSISSSRIRALIQQGEVAVAAELLGRPHSLAGTVVVGDGRGRTIGCPTANLAGVVEVQPSPGVYACEVESIEPGDAWVAPAVVHVGPRPTVDRDETIEAHVIGRTLDLYGKRLRVGFLRRLRGLVRFSDLEALKRQIEQDISEAKRVLGVSSQ